MDFKHLLINYIGCDGFQTFQTSVKRKKKPSNAPMLSPHYITLIHLMHELSSDSTNQISTAQHSTNVSHKLAYLHGTHYFFVMYSPIRKPPKKNAHSIITVV